MNSRKMAPQPTYLGRPVVSSYISQKRGIKGFV